MGSFFCSVSEHMRHDDGSGFVLGYHFSMKDTHFPVGFFHEIGQMLEKETVGLQMIHQII
jgi:hypothetical protein